MFSRQHVSRLLSLGVCLAISAPALAGFAATDSYLLSTGRGSGDLDSEWYTTIWVYNPNDTDATVRFSFLERNRSSPRIATPLTGDCVDPLSHRPGLSTSGRSFSGQTY